MNTTKPTIDLDDYRAALARLRVVTDFLEEVLEHGIPKPPRKYRSHSERMDAGSAHEEWHECRWTAIRDAQALLEETKDI